ncbi:uncharacterized protein KZ484_000780 [Pholidichthys leucotaenia]
MFSDLNNLDPTFGYHRVCYSRFTDKTRVECAEARKKRLAEAHIPEPQEQSGPELSPPTPSPKKRLRSHHAAVTISQASARSSNVLPNICIICKRETLREGPRTNRVTVKLMQAETCDAGLLRQAATEKADETILRHIRNRDCAAIEVKYHGSCYHQYTRFLRSQSESSRRDHVTKEPWEVHPSFGQTRRSGHQKEENGTNTPWQGKHRGYPDDTNSCERNHITPGYQEPSLKSFTVQQPHNCVIRDDYL